MEKYDYQMQEPGFWDDVEKSQETMKKVKALKDTVENFEALEQEYEDIDTMIQMAEEENEPELVPEIQEMLQKFITDFDALRIRTLLSGEFDRENAVVTLHAGTGGTEACDWVSMLYRMYTRWCEKKNYKVEVIDSQPGEEVGIKSLTMFVKGMNAFGYLKNEKGVHRLVRISPFDSNARRHTSFASIDVTPLIENSDIKIEINPSDIRVDVYRSSGCGGQGVNTTDSAVRITHFPTKIVVTCQNERSQIQNKEKAMEVLKSKLYQLEMEKRNNELKELKGNQNDINFGSQIRSYVMCPYSMVKDHRTNVETSNVDKVLDGDIDLFINASLKEVKK